MRKLIIFIIFLAVFSMACTISKNVSEIDVPPKTVTETIVPPKTPTCTVIPENPLIAVVKAEIGLNLREFSTENSKSLYLLKNGDELVIIGIMENGWSCVEFTDESGTFYSGYVNSKYIVLVDVSQTVPLTPEN